MIHTTDLLEQNSELSVLRAMSATWQERVKLLFFKWVGRREGINGGEWKVTTACNKRRDDQTDGVWLHYCLKLNVAVLKCVRCLLNCFSVANATSTPTAKCRSDSLQISSFVAAVEFAICMSVFPAAKTNRTAYLIYARHSEISLVHQLLSIIRSRDRRERTMRQNAQAFS